MTANRCEYKRRYYLANKEHENDRNRAYYAAHKKEIAGYRLAHRGETLVKERAYNAKHPDQVKARLHSYRSLHKVEIAETNRAYWAANPEKKRAKDRRWKTNHPGKAAEAVRVWCAEHPLNMKVIRSKSNAKRRVLGFHALNSPFPGSEAHHINPQDVIHMPKKLHRSISHNMFTGHNMDKINALAGAFLTEDWT